MTGITVLGGTFVRELPERKFNLCEVCFKPFNLANIDMHLEAGCAAEIKKRYKFISMQKAQKKQMTALKNCNNDRKLHKKTTTPQVGTPSKKAKKLTKQ